ncbi:MAG TPA: serine hydrolase domain-containing protein [Kofleriaceae bacterium]|jgi:CubicO group peptidase (beta-lactamase class C family)
MSLDNEAPFPSRGSYADGFAPVAETFARHLREGREVGAGLTIHHRGRCVVDLWGGYADVEQRRPWERDTRVVVFSVTKGLVAMAFAMLADRGSFEWNAPVARYWPEFAAGDKDRITVRELLNHRSGLVGLRERVTLDDCANNERYARIVRAAAAQAPFWSPGSSQGYHAATFGVYAGELFHRIAGESVGTFLAREVFEPLNADVSLGTPAPFDPRIATLYPPSTFSRIAKMIVSAFRPANNEGRVFRSSLTRNSIPRLALLNPHLGRGGIAGYNSVAVRRSELAWASATATAHGISRAYLPFASGGIHDERRYLSASALTPIYARQSWSDDDLVLRKPVGWSQGFLKEETSLFSPNPEAFGHAGIGGSLGFCDPVAETALGYVMNRLDWRVRSPRAIALCHALYECEPMQRQERRGD